MINKLKQEIYKKYGKKLEYTKECSNLAKDLLCVTGESLSYTTIRRFFNFLKTTSSPSKFTLDVFSSYVGYKSWASFNENNKCCKVYSKECEFIDLRKKAKDISQYTYDMIVSQSGLDFAAIIDRPTEERKLNLFLNSKYKATAIVAPGKAGKSSMLAKWYEKLQKDENKDQLIIFINASFMINFMKKDFNFERWLCNQLDYDGQLSDYLSLSDKKQILIIIDAVDEITYDSLKLNRLFVQLNVFLYELMNKSIKLIVSARTSTWVKVVNNTLRNNHLSSYLWEGIQEINPIVNDNLSLLTQKEIQNVLDLSLNTYSEYRLDVDELDSDLIELIRNPYFLELYIKRYEHENMFKYSKSIVLLDNYVNEKTVYTCFSEEKNDILFEIISLSDFGLKANVIQKRDLKNKLPIALKSSGGYYNAYEDMLSSGLIQEQILTNDYGSQSRYVKISNDVVAELLIAKFIIQRNSGVNNDLLNYVDDKYEGSDLKIRLLENIFKYACLQKKTKGLYDFFKLKPSNFINTSLVSTIVKCLDDEETYTSKLWEHYASDKQAAFYILEKFLGVNFMQKQYTKMLKEFLKYSHTRTSQILSASLLLLNSIYSLDTKACDYYYKKTINLYADSSCSVYSTAMWLDSILLYNHFIAKQSNESLLAKLFYYREMVHERINEDNSVNTGDFELFVCNALLQMKNYSKIIQLVDYVDALSNKFNDISINNLKLLKIYSQFSKLKLNMCSGSEFLFDDDESDTSVKNSSNFILQVTHKLMKFDIAIDSENIDLAQHFMDDLLKMCSYGGFYLCEIEVCTKMADLYGRLGYTIKQKICISDAECIMKNKTESVHILRALV